MNTYRTRPEYEKDWKEFAEEHSIDHWIMEWEELSREYAPGFYLPVVYFKTTMTLDEINALPIDLDHHRIIDNCDPIDPNNYPKK